MEGIRLAAYADDAVERARRLTSVQFRGLHEFRTRLQLSR
jgi:hypothetical protein